MSERLRICAQLGKEFHRHVVSHTQTYRRVTIWISLPTDTSQLLVKFCQWIRNWCVQILPCHVCRVRAVVTVCMSLYGGCCTSRRESRIYSSTISHTFSLLSHSVLITLTLSYICLSLLWMICAPSLSTVQATFLSPSFGPLLCMFADRHLTLIRACTHTADTAVTRACGGGADLYYTTSLLCRVHRYGCQLQAHGTLIAAYFYRFDRIKVNKEMNLCRKSSFLPRIPVCMAGNSTYQYMVFSGRVGPTVNASILVSSKSSKGM